MNKKPNYDKRALQRAAYVLLFYIAILLILSFLPSCTTIKYVPVETVRIDTLRQHTIRIDSIKQIDSVYVREYMRGDTIYKEKTKLVYRDRIKQQTDTVNETKILTQEKVVEVEKELTAWQKFKINFSEFIIGVAVLAISAFIVLLIIFRRNKK